MVWILCSHVQMRRGIPVAPCPSEKARRYQCGAVCHAILATVVLNSALSWRLSLSIRSNSRSVPFLESILRKFLLEIYPPLEQNAHECRDGEALISQDSVSFSTRPAGSLCRKLIT